MSRPLPAELLREEASRSPGTWLRAEAGGLSGLDSKLFRYEDATESAEGQN